MIKNAKERQKNAEQERQTKRTRRAVKEADRLRHGERV